MVEFFIFLLLLLLAWLGLSETICVFVNWLLKPKCQAQKYLLIFLTKGFAEQQLLQATENLNWRGNIVANRILAYVGDIDAEEKEMLSRRFEYNKNIVFTDVVQIKGI